MILEGVYEQYKGKQYKVIGVARHSETMEEMVVYEPLYPTAVRLWIRPLSMFLERVKVDGEMVPRFRKLR